MAGSLNVVPLDAPGFLGLNTQDSPTGMDPKFCLTASNAVVDKSGRLAARKGWERFVGDTSLASTNGVCLVHEYITSAGETELIFAVRGGYIYSVDNNGTATLIYTDTSWTFNNWKVVNFNNKCYFFQRGHAPLVYDGTTITAITSSGSYSGTVQQSHEVLSAYGRLWTADTTTDKTTIKWSDTLIGEAWTGGASGSLDLNSVYGSGVRPVTALAAFNGKLVIFCDKTIILYDGANTTPNSTLVLSDIINGVGCIARDSVINIGTDILFLSDSGVRSLGRVIDQKSAPINDLSKNVRDTMVADVVLEYEAATSSYDNIRAGYNELDGYYLLSLPTITKSYCLDLKQRNQDASCRVTTWTIAPLSMCYRINRDFVYGFPTGLGRSSTLYSDDDAVFEFKYTTSYLSGNPQQALQILKFLRILCYGGTGYIIRFLWGVDYAGLTNQTQATFPSAGATSEYNVSEYGIGEYGSNTVVLRSFRQALSGAGQVFQIGIQVPIKGVPFSIQDIDVYTKTGRLSTL